MRWLSTEPIFSSLMEDLHAATIIIWSTDIDKSVLFQILEIKIYISMHIM